MARLGADHVAVAQIDYALAALPDPVSTADERSRAAHSEAIFRAAIGRALDTLRLL